MAHVMQSYFKMFPTQMQRLLKSILCILEDVINNTEIANFLNFFQISFIKHRIMLKYLIYWGEFKFVLIFFIVINNCYGTFAVKILRLKPKVKVYLLVGIGKGGAQQKTPLTLALRKLEAGEPLWGEIILACTEDSK